MKETAAGHPLDRAAGALESTVGAAHVVAEAGPALRVSPASTAEVASVLRICAGHGLPVVPLGGGTGLVGGSQPGAGRVMLSLARLKRIEAIHPDERVAVVEAGVILEDLQTACAAHGLEPGIDLAARGSATIGGMVATNAGGIMAHRYGVMRHRVLGIEAVLPDGTVYSDLTRVVKNTAGYDLKQLFIGSEGTLGVVTRVALKLESLPQETATLLLGLPSAKAAVDCVSLALRAGRSRLRAAEGLWRSYIRLTASNLGWSDASFPLDCPVNLLLMLEGPDAETVQEDLTAIFQTLSDRSPGVTGILAASGRQATQLWRLREETDWLYRAHPGAPSYDVSVPLSAIDGYVDHAIRSLAALDGGIAPYVFGHLADGNLHIVLDRPGPLAPDLSRAVEAALYAPLSGLGGSFSAEHGVGTKRVAALAAYADPGKLAAMRLVKRALDPCQTMNPGTVLPFPLPADETSR